MTKPGPPKNDVDFWDKIFISIVLTTVITLLFIVLMGLVICGIIPMWC